jgi:hypothetical protein
MSDIVMGQREFSSAVFKCKAPVHVLKNEVLVGVTDEPGSKYLLLVQKAGEQKKALVFFDERSVYFVFTPGRGSIPTTYSWISGNKDRDHLYWYPIDGVLFPALSHVGDSLSCSIKYLFEKEVLELLK